MTNKFTKKIIFSGMSILAIAPIVTFASCSIQQNPLETELDKEINEKRKLKIGASVAKINLLNVGEDNEQLSNIFSLPQNLSTEDFRIEYSWDFTKKNIVSFDKSGNIIFEVNVSIYSNKDAQNVITKPAFFTVFIENTTIVPSLPVVPLIPATISEVLPAFRYFYYDDTGSKIEFQKVRSDIFEKSKNFNKDFYSSNSLINDRPVVIETGASKETAIDAYSSEGLIKSPLPTIYNGNRYRFSVVSADFDESNERKGVYKIRVSPEIDPVFNYNVIKYAEDTYGISFDKYYYYYEKNTTFNFPTSNNISSHNNVNSQEASRIGDNISKESLSYMPTLKNPVLIINKNAVEIVKLNSETPGGLFLPPLFERQYSIEPIKPVMIDISSISAVDDEHLNFSILVKVGSGRYQISQTVDKKVDIKQFFNFYK